MTGEGTEIRHLVCGIDQVAHETFTFLEFHSHIMQGTCYGKAKITMNAF